MSDKTVSFPGYVLLNEEQRAPGARSIIITGPSRGGTTFAAALFANLGVAFGRTERDKVSRRYEHDELRNAFGERNRKQFALIVRQFRRKHPSWAWKLPAAHTDFDFITDLVENPSFVFIFKEPLSVAYRKWQARPAALFTDLLLGSMHEYERMALFARRTKLPCLLISYDKSSLDMARCAEACAQFAGVPNIDLSVLQEALAQDARRYFGSATATASA